MTRIGKAGGLLTASLVATVLLTGGAAPGGAAPTEYRPYSWDVAGIGASGRTLRLQYTSARDCNGTFLGPRSRVVETATAVTIDLFDVVDLPPPEARLTCPLSLPAPRPAFVTLSAPLAGRSVKGRILDPSASTPVGPPTSPPQGGEGTIRVPRVVGFSVWEARRIIWRSGLNVEIRRSKRSVARTQVVAQGPSGRLAPQETVRLQVAYAR